MIKIDLQTELVQRCVSGDRAAQQQLYSQYSKGMYNVCCRMVGDRMLAEDILQESFVDVFRNMRSFKGDSTPGAWIKRIVVNNCISHLRKRKVYFDDIDEGAHQLAAPVEVHDDNSYEVQMIKNAIRKLPHGYKVIFSLYAIEGYDHEEIASIMDISVSTSKSQYHRAKNKIRELVKSTNHG